MRRLRLLQLVHERDVARASLPLAGGRLRRLGLVQCLQRLQAVRHVEELRGEAVGQVHPVRELRGCQGRAAAAAAARLERSGERGDARLGCRALPRPRHVQGALLVELPLRVLHARVGDAGGELGTRKLYPAPSHPSSGAY